MPWLGLWWVLLGGDTQPCLDGELAGCILLPRVPNGDFQFSWLSPSPFPTVTKVFIVTQILGVILRLLGCTDTPLPGGQHCFLASVNPNPSLTPILGGALRRDERPSITLLRMCPQQTTSSLWASVSPLYNPCPGPNDSSGPRTTGYAGPAKASLATRGRERPGSYYRQCRHLLVDYG